MIRPGTLLHQRYQITRLIGKGGMGAVYESTDTRLRCTVALKHMLVSNEPDFVKAFEREAQILAGLRHPILPVVTDYFTEDEGYFLVMQYLPGDNLAERLAQQNRPFALDQVLDWADMLLDGLNHLHTQNPPIIHRDIKPQNLKITSRGEIVLLDFGLAKGLAELSARSGSYNSLFGYTLQYSPIEQIRGSGTDARSDLYSLAATIHHLISGVLPANALERTTMIAEGRPDILRPAHLDATHVPKAVSAVLLQALALNPDKRIHSAALLRASLQAARQASTAMATPSTNTTLSSTAVDTVRVEPLRQQEPAKLSQQVVIHQRIAANNTPVKIAGKTAMQPRPVQSGSKAWLMSGAGAVMVLGVLILIGGTRNLDAVPITIGGATFLLGLVALCLLMLREPARPALAHNLSGHTDDVVRVAFAPSGHVLASASKDATARLWHAGTGEPLSILKGHQGHIWSVVFPPDGQILASASKDTTIRLWRVRDGSLLHTLIGHTGDIWSVAFSPDGQILASASKDTTIRLWRVRDGSLLHTLIGHTGDVWSVAFSPDGQILASTSEDATVRLWRVSHGGCLHTLEGHSESVSSVAFAPNGQLLASGSDDTTVRLWQIGEGTLLGILQAHTKGVLGVAFAPDGKKLASRSSDATVGIWQTNDGSLQHQLIGHAGPISGMAFSPNGQMLVTASWDSTLRLWRVRDGVLLERLRGHTARVWSVTFASDSQTLASGSMDRTIKIWHTTPSGNTNR